MRPPTVPRNYPVSSFKMAAERVSGGGSVRAVQVGAVVSKMKWLIRMEEEEVHLNSSCISNIPRIAQNLHFAMNTQSKWLNSRLL